MAANIDNNGFYFFCDGCDKSCSYREANCFVLQRSKSYRKGDYIAYKGDSVRNLSILISGKIAVSIVLDSGVSLPARVHNAPYPMGALALFSVNNIYRVDIVAMEDCEVRSVSREEVESQMLRCPRFMRNFIGYTASKFDVITTHLSLLTHRTIKAKLAYYILSRPIGENGDFSFEKKVGELAEYLCVERPSLSRTLAQFVDEKIVTYSRGEGRILNLEKLRELIE